MWRGYSLYALAERVRIVRIELSAIPQVIPTPGTDLREHTRTTPCMCHPRVVPTDNGIVLVHNSFDGREAYELDFSMNE